MHRTIIAAVAAALVGAVIAAPVAVEATSNLMVLKDAASNDKARVDAGKVRVGDGSGALTVDEAWRPFQRRIAVVVSAGELSGTAGFTVPVGRRVVLEFASHQSGAGYGLKEVGLAAKRDGSVHRNFLDVVANGSDRVVSQSIQLYGAPRTRIEATFRHQHAPDHTVVYYLFVSGRYLPAA